ncbi:hypothetical protein HZS_4339 [Henneguya salminicola]|nr:hypothetical protein HZS_4339 [Henneguya salminicola]
MPQTPPNIIKLKNMRINGVNGKEHRFITNIKWWMPNYFCTNIIWIENSCHKKEWNSRPENLLKNA